MPTDYACQAAAEQAAHGIAPVRALLVPSRRPAQPQQEEVPVVIRSFLGSGGPSPAPVHDPEPYIEPVGAPMGAAVLLTFLDGLRADLGGVLVDWYSAIPVQLPMTLGVPGSESSGRQPARVPNGWQSMADLQANAQDVLTVLAGRPRNGQVGPAELSWRLAMLEDVFAGALRRMGIPGETSAECADELVSATGSLFGLSRPTPRSASPQHTQSY